MSMNKIPFGFVVFDCAETAQKVLAEKVNYVQLNYIDACFGFMQTDYLFYTTVPVSLLIL